SPSPRFSALVALADPVEMVSKMLLRPCVSMACCEPISFRVPFSSPMAVFSARISPVVCPSPGTLNLKLDEIGIAPCSPPGLPEMFGSTTSFPSPVDHGLPVGPLPDRHALDVCQ